MSLVSHKLGHPDARSHAGCAGGATLDLWWARLTLRAYHERILAYFGFISISTAGLRVWRDGAER